jgi:hypothetical protein
MEPLWSPAVATGRSRWQMERPRKRLGQAQTVAVGCDRLPERFHGKEGVDGSSPSEGLARQSHSQSPVPGSGRSRAGISRLTNRASSGVGRTTASGRCALLVMRLVPVAQCIARRLDSSRRCADTGWMGILGSLLPGLREIRAPLAAGFLWLLACWLVVRDEFEGDGSSRHGSVDALLDLKDQLGDAAFLGALTFVAYIAGSLWEPVARRLADLLWRFSVWLTVPWVIWRQAGGRFTWSKQPTGRGWRSWVPIPRRFSKRVFLETDIRDFRPSSRVLDFSFDAENGDFLDENLLTSDDEHTRRTAMVAQALRRETRFTPWWIILRTGLFMKPHGVRLSSTTWNQLYGACEQMFNDVDRTVGRNLGDRKPREFRLYNLREIACNQFVARAIRDHYALSEEGAGNGSARYKEAEQLVDELSREFEDLEIGSERDRWWAEESADLMPVRGLMPRDAIFPTQDWLLSTWKPSGEQDGYALRLSNVAGRVFSELPLTARRLSGEQLVEVSRHEAEVDFRLAIAIPLLVVIVLLINGLDVSRWGAVAGVGAGAIAALALIVDAWRRDRERNGVLITLLQSGAADSPLFERLRERAVSLAPVPPKPDRPDDDAEETTPDKDESGQSAESAPVRKRKAPRRRPAGRSS